MATLIKANGEETNVLPKNKTDFKLDELQTFVGGIIEIVKTKDGRTMVINEEGKINELPINQKATDIYLHGNFDFIVGDVVVCNSNEID